MKSAMACLAAAFVIAAALPAGAQAPKRKPPPLGSNCHAPLAGTMGVVKRNACGQLYCGSTTFKDPIEVIPNIAERNKCRWTIVSNQCRCVRAPSSRR